MTLAGYEFDCGGIEMRHTQRGDMLYGDSAVCGSVEAGYLSDLGCVRTGGTDLASDCEEIVPDSEDEEVGRQEVVDEARARLVSGLGIDTIIGNESIRSKNQGPFINGLAADVEEQGIVADSEEECDTGYMKKFGNSAHRCLANALDSSANGSLDVGLLKHPFMAGGGRVMNEHERIFSNHDIFSKKGSECLNESQQPGESSQADALKFVDNFVKCNDFELSSKGVKVKQTSPPKSCSKGVKVLAQKISNRTAAAAFSSYNWIDREPNKQGGLFNRSDVLFYSRQRMRRANNKPVITAMKSNNANICSVSSIQQEKQEVANHSSETNGEVQTGETFIYASEEVKQLAEVPISIVRDVDHNSNVETRTKQGDPGTDEGCENETFDDVFNTQVAAAVLETLSFEPPKKCSGYILSESLQTIITDNPKDSMEKVTKLGPSSPRNGKFSVCRQNGDRLKLKNRTCGKACSEKSAFIENGVKKMRHVDPHFSFRQGDKPCNEKIVSDKLSGKTAVERKGNQAASEFIKEVYEKPPIISLDSEQCCSFSKPYFDTKFSTSLSPLRWMSKAQQSSGLKTKDGTKDLVNTYKRRRSAMLRKENRNPNVSSDLAEFKSNIASTKEPEEEDLSHVTPFSCIDLNKLIIPKGKRKSRGSIKLKHLDTIGNVRSEADTEKEVKCPLAKKYKPTNHWAEPAWLKFSRKRRTSAAHNKQANGIDSCKAEHSKRFSSDLNESRSCVGGGKDAIFADSNTFNGSNSLTSVSSNSRIMPPVSSLNSAYYESSRPKKMPKPSLIRELVQLEFSDIPLDSSCKNLRRRKHIANVRVLARLGISIATSASDATHFVTNTFSRTKNMLEAIALGIPIVTELWLENCAQAGCLVDEKNYILKDARKEKEIGFSLSASLAKAARHPLLKDCKVFITTNIKPDKDMLISLVKMVQGEVVEITKNYEIPENVIVLSCQEDYSLCMPFLDKGIPVYHSELLLNGIVTQKLELKRIRSRDGLERVTIDNSKSATISDLKSSIESQLRVPIQSQTLSTNQNLLLAKTPSDAALFTDMVNPHAPLASLNLSHGSMVYLAYEGERNVAGRPAVFTPAGSFGKKMTMDDLIAKQMRVSRQEQPNCELVSFDRDAANGFQQYVNETLAFAIKRGGFMYGVVTEEGKVEVNFIYEPPQDGSEEVLTLLRDPEEEKLVDAIAMGLGMRRVGFIFTQTVSQDKKDYTLSNREVLQAAELHAEGGIKEWVTAIVKLEVNEDGGADVHFEAFQLSDTCVKLFKEDWFETEIGEDDDPKLSKMKKDVVVGVKDTKEVDNDFFLVVVKIADHQGPLSSSFPVENRITSVTLRALKNHLDRARNMPFVKRISDFHLLLLIARYFDINNDIPTITEYVLQQKPIPEGYQLIIESLANAS
ncbi:unnamed protein product [Rhodiola kirilowii]